MFLSGSRDRPQQGAPSSPPRGPGPRIDDLISTALTKGPVTKDSLRKEWASLAGQIQKQELHGEMPLQNPGALRVAVALSEGTLTVRSPLYNSDALGVPVAHPYMLTPSTECPAQKNRATGLER